MKMIYYFNPSRPNKDQSIVKAIYGEEINYLYSMPWTILSDFEKGDILICNSVDELVEVTDIVQNLDIIVKEYMDIYNKGVELVFDKSTQCNSLFVKTLTCPEQTFETVLRKCILNYANQKNVEIKYSKKHVVTARNNGNTIGVKKGTKFITKKSLKMKEKIIVLSKDFEGNMADEKVIEEIGISRNSYYKYKKELKEDGGV